jgi:hypothetical protein
MRPLRNAMAFLLVCGLTAGCAADLENLPGGEDDGADDGADGTGGDEGGTDDGPGGPGGGGSDDPVEGDYEITTTYDGSSNPLLGGTVGGLLATLTRLAADPADTLIDVLESAGIPIVGELLAILDPLLLDDLNGFINEYVLNRVIEGVSLPARLNGLVGNLTGLLTQFDMVSQLDLTSLDANGLTSASHALSGVNFLWEGQTFLADTPDLLDQATAADDVVCQVAMDGAEGAMELADHAFQVPFGDFAVEGLNQALAQTLGVANVREALGQMFDCPSMAQEVSSRCILVLCVGHRAELEEFCEAGLDQVAADIEDRIRVFDFGSLRFESGQAVLTGGEDGFIDGIQGTWQSVLEVDGVEVPLSAPFVGRRIQ